MSTGNRRGVGKQKKPTKVNVNVSISDDELSEIKAVTHIDTSATAILAAARQGVEYLRSHLACLNQPQSES